MSLRQLADAAWWQRCQDGCAAALSTSVATFDESGVLVFSSAGRSLERAGTILLPYIREHPTSQTIEIAPGTLCVATPLTHNGNVIGCLAAGPYEEGHELESAHAALRTLAALLPEGSAWRVQAQEQLQALRLVLDFATQLGSKVDIQQLAATTLTFIGRQFNFDDAAVWFEETTLRLRPEDQYSTERSLAERRLLAQVISANNVVHIPDIRRDFMFKDIARIDRLANAIFALPLRVAGKAHGMLVVYGAIGTPFESGSSLLQGIAERLGASLDRAHSLRSAQVSAVTDPLTGLNNKRQFLASLERELAQGKHGSRNSALILFDIDNFKSYNDTYGHPAGDALLQQIGMLVRRCAGPLDIASRYGGEEFAIIVPDTTAEDAHKAAERIRQAIEQHPFEKRQCTISVGCVLTMRSNSIPSVLLAETDKALYNSKRTGKNKVTTIIIVDSKIHPIPYNASM